MSDKIAVVGGGVGGCFVALGLAVRGADVTLFEREEALLAGASGRALGGLFPYSADIKTRLAEVQRASVAGWVDMSMFLEAWSGVARGEFFRDFGEIKQVRVSAMREILSRALEGAGVLVRLGFTPAAVPDEAADAWAGFDKVIWACGVGNASFFGEDFDVVAGTVVRVAGISGTLKTPLRGLKNGVYAVPDWDGTWLVGGEKERVSAVGEGCVDDAVVAALLAKAEALLPGVREAEIVESWVGYRPSVRRGAAMLPLVRQVSERDFAVAPLGGIGWCLAPALFQNLI
ncbi:MAG: hypothetical protein COY40_03270 [Alphaproteobacteria bacterium CG_4_10_14_0_8_um_filter_53_9]|nr:MAG: hypothetical protein COY40_03270 [Alphaproteobacteria bacterium CG_4_10_14_0_8_um_filter_53_9]